MGENKPNRSGLLDGRTYQQLMERASDGVVIIQNEILQYINPQFEEMLDYTAGEIVGTRFMEHVHPDDADALLERYRRRLAGEPVPSVYEIHLTSCQRFQTSQTSAS